MDASHLSLLNDMAKEEGLLLLGAVGLDVGPAYEQYSRWLADNKNAGMGFLENNLSIRADPRLLLDGAKSLFVFGYQYGPQTSTTLEAGFGRIASYSRMRDYHKFLRAHLKKIIAQLELKFPASSNRALVDSAPILERSFAAKTRAGFIGKNTCYIHPTKGSFILLSEIISTLEVAPLASNKIDPNIRTADGGCGSCKRCQVHCPTGALDDEYVLDANKCISYWTIEHRGVVPKKWWPYFRHYIFGCDICQNVCPYNRKVELTTNIAYRHSGSLDLFKLAILSQEDYVKIYGGTPLTRAKRTGLRRNALIAMHVSQDSRLLKAIAHLENDSDDVLRQTVGQMSSE